MILNQKKPNKRSTSDKWQVISDKLQVISDKWQVTSDKRQVISDKRQKTIDGTTTKINNHRSGTEAIEETN